MESLWLGIVLALVLLVMAGQVFGIYAWFDALKNSGFVVVRIWGIKLVRFSFEVRGSGIVIRTTKKRKEIEYALSDPKMDFYRRLGLEVKDKMRIKVFNLEAWIGTGDAEKTAMLCAGINALLGSLKGWVKNLKPTAGAWVVSQPDFGQKRFEMRFYGKGSMSIFDLVYGILSAVFDKKQA